LPIDPASPQERIAYVLRDSGAGKAIARQGMAPTLRALGIEVLDPTLGNIDASVANPTHVNTPDHLCYVIYTS
ncbi:hypothetical protein, partial [Pseudomonas corrugata]|uniref:hypothetical protein n=1 Tax=Pseudomonas corrugata TaxID=47879 RepID=UPI0018EF380A